MKRFGRFYLDTEKDIPIDLYFEHGEMVYLLQTPNHHTGNLITNLARLCDLPLEKDEQGYKIIRGIVPCYIDEYNRTVYILRLGNTKVANIYPDGTIERKASIPSIAKTLMSQTKEYSLNEFRTIIKTYIRRDYKFCTDLHTHMNANLHPDILIALGIFHQIRYPLYYIRKLGLRLTDTQQKSLEKQREAVAESFKGSPLTGKYLTRRISDHTYINFADLILNNLKNASWNIPRIRASLSILKDGQAVFTNLEKVYLYRYVFTKGVSCTRKISLKNYTKIPDPEIIGILRQIQEDQNHPQYRKNSLFQNKLLWIARAYQKQGICYAEISDTTLVKPGAAFALLKEIHEVMPAVTEETGVCLRFLAGIRRIPLTIIRDSITADNYLQENLQVLRTVSIDPYVAGSDIIGEEINDITELQPLIRELIKITDEDPTFVIRIHAGENDSLPENVANSIRCVKDSLRPGQKFPHVRIGHGLYTANLRSAKGRQLIQELIRNKVVLEFQLSSNVRLNNLNSLADHPLKRYLHAGVFCVQGTDGSGMYGTDPMSEQLSLERLLSLSDRDMKMMHSAELEILKDSRKTFTHKQERFASLCGDTDPQEFYSKRFEETAKIPFSLARSERLDTTEVLSAKIRELPESGIPIVLAGGSFNNTRHQTKLREDLCSLIDELLTQADPGKYYFVIGHKLSGYENYLLKKNQGKFPVYAFVPSEITRIEYQRLSSADLSVRTAIEPVGMGIYKSVVYEIFKQRPSILLALDGNSAGANLIQEANNSKYPCRIYVCDRARTLKAKAESLQGYVRLFRDPEGISEQILNETF